MELALAGLLATFGWLLGDAAVGEGFIKASRITDNAGRQIRLIRRQVHDLQRPEMQTWTRQLQEQTHAASVTLQNQQVNYETMRAMADALGDVAAGLRGIGESLQNDPFGKVGAGLGETAAFLEQVIPAAAKAADDLEATTAALKADAQSLKSLFQEHPFDLQAAREVHDTLTRFRSGIDPLTKLLASNRLDGLRDGFEGMETALTTGAEQVERLSHYSYPAVVLKGFKPEVTQKPFWPEGETIAKGLRQAASGLSAASKEMTSLREELPRLRTSLEESRSVLDRTSQALAVALRQQDKLEPLLKDIPAKAAQLAENLPRVGQDLVRLLRDTRRLQEVATALRQGQQGVANAKDHWPQLRQTLERSATLLAAARRQLEQVLDNRDQYERARQQGVHLAESFGTTLPLLSEGFNGQLQDQDQALEDLAESIDEVGTLLPTYGRTAERSLQIGRWLVWLVAAMVALHGAYLGISGWTGKRWGA
jgi:ABC-type transporter Mla subunit MlaD